ncbi:shadow of prion protein [Lampris incognitus]|uniref:shadow of prion protein n=1 Tax=Lampris incognitus TaxID=2546036 RepID=UPI0024B49B30|nr:shadow of prion protein [Lampris incognitus]
MAVMNRVVATCWTCLLLCAFLCEPVLPKGGRGGSRGSSRGSSGGGYRRGAYGGVGTRSRFRVAGGRTSPVRVAAAAAAGAAVALTADKWYASAFRRSSADSSGEEPDHYNRTSDFDAQMSGSPHSVSSLTQMLCAIVITAVATLSPKYGYL